MGTIDGKKEADDVGRTRRTPLHPACTARYVGVCVRCEGRISIGARVAYYKEYGGWSHVRCPRKLFTVAEVEATAAKLVAPLMDALRERQLAAVRP